MDQIMMKLISVFSLCVVLAGCASMGLPLDTDEDLTKIRKALEADNPKQREDITIPGTKQIPLKGNLNNLTYTSPRNTFRFLVPHFATDQVITDANDTNERVSIIGYSDFYDIVTIPYTEPPELKKMGKEQYLKTMFTTRVAPDAYLSQNPKAAIKKVEYLANEFNGTMFAALTIPNAYLHRTCQGSSCPANDIGIAVLHFIKNGQYYIIAQRVPTRKISDQLELIPKDAGRKSIIEFAKTIKFLK